MGAIKVHEFMSLDGDHALLADGLSDELHLFVYPLTRGSGPRLFPEDAAPRKLSLAANAAYDNGVVYLNYRSEA